MRRALLAVTIFVRLLLQSAEAGTVTLAWNPNTESDLEGYFLSYGTAPGNYTTTIDVGNVTSYQFSEPNPAVRYYLALRAYNTSGGTSSYSNEVVTTPAPPLTVTGLSSNKTSPQPVGTAIVFSAIASGGIAPYQFKWWIDNGATSTVGQQWSASNTFTWTPTSPSSSYSIRVWARNAGSAADAPDNPGATLTMTFNITSVANQAPAVNAGTDKTITLPATATLSGTVSDDGKPTPPGTLTLTWTRVSGPGTVTFSAPNAVSTTATFSTSGTYVLRLTASDSTLSSSDDATVTVNPAPGGGTGAGLAAQYFNDPTTGAQFTNLIVTRTDATVNFSWSQAAPVSGVNSDYFSVRWTGQVLAPSTGTYRFATTSDDGVRLWVNGQLVINNWTEHAPTVDTSPAISLTAGVRYNIQLEFYERVGAAQIRLRWTPPGQPESVIPSTQLTPSPSGNQAPTVNAGPDQSVTLPAALTLNGTVTDDQQPTPPGVVTLNWTSVSGPGTVTFSPPNAVSTTATFSTSGTYVLRLTASDSVLSTSDDLTVTVSPAPPANQAPTVNAGTDRSITLPSGVTLTGTAADDGLPTPPATLTVSWTRVSGPGTVTFSPPNAVSTTATFSTSGTYVLRLTASDSVLSTSDDLTVTVSPAPPANQPPTVNAGTDRSITLPSGVTLTGTAADDGLPTPPATLTVTWTRVSGPGTVTFSPPNAVSTTATFSTSGTYVLRLTASDSVLSTSDDLTVTVSPAAPANQAPTVNAGTDRSITLPSGVTLTGTAADDGLPTPPGTLTVSWTRVSGPGTVTFSPPNAVSTTATFSTSGTYVLRLTASDSVLSTSDDLTVTVSPAGGGIGTGLGAQYFNDPTTGGYFTTLAVTRTDPTVNFDWAQGSPVSGVNSDYFSVRWTGQVLAPTSGTYTFATTSDDGVRLWVNGQLLIDNWTVHASTKDTSGPITLTAGTRYDVRLEFYDQTSRARIQLLWTRPGQSESVIPTAQLFP